VWRSVSMPPTETPGFRVYIAEFYDAGVMRKLKWRWDERS